MRMVLVTCAVVVASMTCPVSASTTTPPDPQPITATDSEGSITTPSGLVYRIVAPGEGPAAKPGDSVRIHETTTLADGTLIYSTRTAGRPLKFLLGGKQVIDGVDEGVTGMKVGERRTMIVPPSLSQRTEYPANIPKDAVLYYDVELVEIVKK